MRKLVLAAALVATALACHQPPAARPQVVIIGFDGMDPALARRWMKEERLPHLARVAAAGGIYDLATTPAAESAMVWTSFATGANAGQHNVFDTLMRDPATYRRSAAWASREPPRLLLNFIQVEQEKWSAGRRVAPFWTVAGAAGVRSSVLAVPGTFPPDAVPNGELLAGAPLPDLRGTRGTYHYFATNLPAADEDRSPSGSVLQRLVFERRVATAALLGPATPISGEPATLPFTITWNHEARSVNVAIGGTAVYLREREWSRWIDLEFQTGSMTRVRGMTQLFLIGAGTELQLFVSPLQWHPNNPPAPISHPERFSAELFDRLGHYRTLDGLAAAMALDEERIDEAAFLDEIDRAFQDRAETILNRLDGRHWDLLVGVFDSLDHVQHMLWRLTDPRHPRYDAELARRYGGAIELAYRQADEFVGELLERVRPDTIVMIVSGHGFHPFRATVNLNTWLVQNGYMTLENARIVWPQTRAYASGPGQLYVNLRGREGHGIVAPGAEYDQVIAELERDLGGLVDPRTGTSIVRRVDRGVEIYDGPYAANAPDLQVGLAPGYRAHESMTVSSRVIEPNLRKWSGDHVSIDAQATAGVLVTNARLTATATPRLIDIAPTVLTAFGVASPPEMDGRPLIDMPVTNSDHVARPRP